MRVRNFRIDTLGAAALADAGGRSEKACRIVEERARAFVSAIGPAPSAPLVDDDVVDVAGEEAALAFLARAALVRS